jgi:DMSO reductase family type II enzyme chaperone
MEKDCMVLNPEERSLIYGRLSRVFSYPLKDDYEAIIGGYYLEPFYLLGEEIISLLERISYPSSLEEWQQEYTQLFDVGMGTGGPPCPLYEGCYRPDWGRSKLFEELLRFYDFFGLGLSPDSRELPDHLTVELEFMHFLTYQEAKAEDNISYLRAQRDFLKRHLIPWLPIVKQRIDELEASEYFRALGYILDAFIRTESEYLKNVI